jgi:hypothetical protein
LAIGDYFRTLTILENNPIEKGLGPKDNWEVLDTVSGLINKSGSSELVNGKRIVVDVYKAITEINSNIDSSKRLKDTDNRIYKIIGEPKNTLNMNHHYKIDLEYCATSQD